ncbi:hypothetical protein HA402_004149, partial [Bradysia odoriphaga]
TRTYLIVASLFVLAFCVKNGISIKCWECSSQGHPGCADEFDNSTQYITDCDQIPGLYHLSGVRPSMCRRIRQKVNGEWRYIRSCAYMRDESSIVVDDISCLMRTGANNLVMEYCTCNHKDGCNSSTLASPKIMFVYVAMIFSLGFRFLCRV